MFPRTSRFLLMELSPASPAVPPKELPAMAAPVEIPPAPAAMPAERNGTGAVVPGISVSGGNPKNSPGISDLGNPNSARLNSRRHSRNTRHSVRKIRKRRPPNHRTFQCPRASSPALRRSAFSATAPSTRLTLTIRIFPASAEVGF